MLEEKCNIWDKHDQGEIVCITTNGYVKTNGQVVMGRGVALQAAKRFPGLAIRTGGYIKAQGYANVVFDETARLVIFPVKPDGGVSLNGKNVVSHQRHRFPDGAWVPGWAMAAHPSIIRRSLERLDRIRRAEKWERVYLPRPGCGAGELDWETQVKPICEPYGDWLVIVTL